MSDQPGGLWRLRKPISYADAGMSGTGRPIMVVALTGFALAIIVVISFFLPTQLLSNAAHNARPLLIGIYTAPLAISMLIAIIVDGVSGKSSLLATLRQFGALLLVFGCIVLGLLIMQQPDVLTVAGGSLLIGFAVGLSLAFASGASATYTDAGLAILGWSAFAVPTLAGLIVYIITYKPDPTLSGHCYTCGGLVSALEGAVCCGAFAIALFLGITVVPIGGVIGGWLRRGNQPPTTAI